jgi:DNA repair exonuclease SbcCD nuclease subunit
MRLMHMADAHFGKRFSSSRFGPESAAGRRTALEDALRMAVRYANEARVDFILSAGDLIESSDVRPSDIRRLDEILSGLTQAKIVAVTGNHDPLDALSPYHRLQCDQLVLLPPGYSRTMLDEDTALHAYSFPEAVQRVNPLQALPLDMAAPRNILLLHCDAISPESDYLPARMDFLKRFDYCALGHVHQPLALSPRVRYSGSLIGLERNETGPRGFVIVDLDEKLTERFHPLPIPTFEALTVELSPGMGEGAQEAAILGALEALPPDNLYSVTLTGMHPTGARPDVEAMEARLRSGGRQVVLIDQTHPAYDLSALSREHRDDLIGQVIASFGPEEGRSERDQLALEYALTALWEGGHNV